MHGKVKAVRSGRDAYIMICLKAKLLYEYHEDSRTIQAQPTGLRNKKHYTEK
jgi:hypothetical protein